MSGLAEGLSSKRGAISGLVMLDSVRGSANQRTRGGSREVYPNLVDLLCDRVVDSEERGRKRVVVVLVVAGEKCRLEILKSGWLLGGNNRV